MGGVDSSKQAVAGRCAGRTGRMGIGEANPLAGQLV